jgi:hypothetical protein
MEAMMRRVMRSLYRSEPNRKCLVMLLHRMAWAIRLNSDEPLESSRVQEVEQHARTGGEWFLRILESRCQVRLRDDRGRNA